MSDDPWDKAKQMATAKAKWGHIAQATGLSVEKLRRRLEPGYAERRRQGVNEARAARRGDEVRKGPPSRNYHFVDNHVAPDDAERALRSVPADTRTPTARMMGDPLPGRSALARRPMPNPDGLDV